jgi:conjugal transfer pilus assembly protein TraV
MISHKLLSVGALALVVSGCSSFMPYSSQFSCKNDDHGRCIEPLNAYAVAVTETEDSLPGTVDRGVAVNPNAEKKGRGRSWRSRGGRRISEPQPIPNSDGDTQLVGYTPATGYEGYQQALYRELTGMIDRPETPMLTPPKTVRTLILPYSDSQAAGTLYMPRFVYSIVESPRFVMGNYLTRQQDDDLASFLAAGRLNGEDGVFQGTEGPTGEPLDLRLPEPSGPELPSPDADPAEGLLPTLTSLEARTRRASDGGQ